MPYVTRQPHAALTPWVERLGLQHDDRVDPTARPTRIVPTGTVDLVFHYGDAFQQVTDSGPVTEPAAYVTGQRLVPLQARATGRTGVLVISLHPWAMPAVLHAPATAPDTPSCDLAHFVEPGALEALLDRLRTAATAGARLDAAEAWLRGRLEPTLDPLARSAALRLAQAPELRIAALADALGVSRRQLDRRFAAAIGLAPKPFQRVLRFQRALGALRRGHCPADAATAAGYHDQPHLHREVRALAGVTPETLRRDRPETGLTRSFNRPAVSPFYNTVYLA